jgi:hypothetical protein
VFHGDDLVFAWVVRWYYFNYGPDTPPVPVPLTPDERELQDVTSSYWINLAREGTPNAKGTGYPVWPEAHSNATQQPRMLLDVGKALGPAPSFREQYCAFWDKYPTWPDVEQ